VFSRNSCRTQIENCKTSVGWTRLVLDSLSSRDLADSLHPGPGFGVPAVSVEQVRPQELRTEMFQLALVLCEQISRRNHRGSVVGGLWARAQDTRCVPVPTPTPVSSCGELRWRERHPPLRWPRALISVAELSSSRAKTSWTSRAGAEIHPSM